MRLIGGASFFAGKEGLIGREAACKMFSKGNRRFLTKFARIKVPTGVSRGGATKVAAAKNVSPLFRRLVHFPVQRTAGYSDLRTIGVVGSAKDREKGRGTSSRSRFGRLFLSAYGLESRSMTISTRRLLARPSAESFLAIGLSLPRPRDWM